MDNKTIFVKTSKGEDEMLSRTSHLADDVKRALLMVDGSSTFGEISKRAAPSMRASLGETLQELEKNGFIQDMDAVGKTPRIAVPPRMAVPSKMVVPTRTPTPKQQPVDDAAGGELDFMSGFTASEVPGAGPTEAENLRAETDGISQQEMEAAIFGTPQGAEAIPHVSEADKLKAEQETRLRIEDAVRAQKQAEEAVHIKAEQQAAKAREAAQPSQATPGAKPDTFAFDAFHVDASQDFAFGKFKIDEPRGSAEPHKERQPEQPASPAAKPTTFAFDAFQIDEPFGADVEAA